MKRSFPLVLVILFVYFSICFYHLSILPGEWYGDISIEHEYVTRILYGNFSFVFDQSAGPAYHFFITPFIALLGGSYLSYKIASILTGGIGIILLFYFGKALLGYLGGAFTAFVGAVSFWYISFCRLGSSPQILTPVLAVGVLYSLLEYRRKQHIIFLILSLSIAFIGLFTYPATFHFPVLVLLYTIGFVWKRYKKTKNVYGIPLVVSGFGVALSYGLFLSVVSQQTDLFTNGYIGAKFISHAQSFGSLLSQWGTNIGKTFFMFWGTGDVTFRVNVPRSSHLDIVSGVLFAVGIGRMIFRRERLFWFIGAPIFFFLLPSTAPGIPPSEVPSMSRNFAVTPFVFLTIAYVLKWIHGKLQRKWIRWGSMVCILGSIVVLNLTKYFVEYPKSLPNGNIPFGKIIASYVNSLPKDIDVKLAGCCWGAWGQPEPKSIYYQLQFQEGRKRIVTDPFLVSCAGIDLKKDTLVVLNPSDMQLETILTDCFPEAEIQHHNVGMISVFTSFFIPRRRMSR